MAAAESYDMNDDTARSEDAENDNSESTTESVDNTAEIEIEDATEKLMRASLRVLTGMISWKVMTLGVAMVC